MGLECLARDFDASARVKAEGTAGRPWSADKAGTPVAGLSALEEGRPEGSNREPGLRQEHPPKIGLRQFSREMLGRVNPNSVSKVVDHDAGRTQVLGFALRSRRSNLATVRQRLLNAWQTLG
jgi:hypothetical protein